MKRFTRIIITLIVLITVTVGSFSPLLIKPKEAKAFAMVIDIVQQALDLSFDIVARSIARTMLQNLQNNMISWAQGGRLNPIQNVVYGGSNISRFVRDWDQFLGNAADHASGLFIEQMGLTRLCEPFDSYLKNIFQAQRPSFAQSYTFRAECTLDGIVANIRDFRNDFRVGSWTAWNSSFLTENNIYGSTIAANDEMLAQVTTTVSEASNIADTGYIGEVTCAPADRFTNATTGESFCANPTVDTPGQVVGDSVSSAINADFDWLTDVDEMGELIASLASGAFIRVISNSLSSAPANTGVIAGNEPPYTGPTTGGGGAASGISRCSAVSTVYYDLDPAVPGDDNVTQICTEWQSQ